MNLDDLKTMWDDLKLKSDEHWRFSDDLNTMLGNRGTCFKTASDDIQEPFIRVGSDVL